MPGDLELTLDELRDVVRFVIGSAAPVLPIFESAHPDDVRPRAAIDAAQAFADGAPRTKLQRITSLDAHRAAAEAGSEGAKLAARSAGDAASAAYLHPLARARATPVLIEVLGRYPIAPTGRSRVAVLMSELDASLRRT